MRVVTVLLLWVAFLLLALAVFNESCFFNNGHDDRISSFSQSNTTSGNDTEYIIGRILGMKESEDSYYYDYTRKKGSTYESSNDMEYIVGKVLGFQESEDSPYYDGDDDSWGSDSWNDDSDSRSDDSWGDDSWDSDW